jgi:BirA family biotin operon repressor/biotin-[acetyl-CoA-carboxylase] ligase
VLPLVDAETIHECLKGLTLNPQVILLPEVDSTNDEAKRRIESGLSEEFLIVAETQTHGRGRKDRTWISPKGGLYLSLAIFPPLNIESTPLLGLLCACAIAKALEKMGVDGVCVKWPNDVLIKRNKIAGILIELVSVGFRKYMTILGIGINQNTNTSEFPEEFRYSVTSVIEHLGRATSSDDLLCKVLHSIDEFLQFTRSSGSYEAVLSEWRRINTTLGTRVRVDDGSKIYVGTAEELLSDGSLIISTKTGVVTLRAGDVTHLHEDQNHYR